MASSVWKFVLPWPDKKGNCFARMPADSHGLSVGIQDGRMVVWAVCDTSDKERLRRFIVVNTGQDLSEAVWRSRFAFLGTVTAESGVVWHVWDGGG